MLLRTIAIAVLSLATGASTSPAGWWTGRYTLAGPGTFTVRVDGSRATVALGLGHAGAQVVTANVDGPRVRFSLPGRPAPVVFAGSVSGGQFTGTVHQGALRGTFRARRGEDRGVVAAGFYGRRAVVDDPYGPERLVDVDSGAVNALYPSGGRFVIGSGFATRAPARGFARLTDRQATRQLEVRFRSGDAVLSGTLTLPPSRGPHAAVAFVTGSGETTRSYLPDLQALLIRNDVAVLAYDKRGIGQSGGHYPGESPTASTIDVLARDASAAVRFLGQQPEIDRARIGLAGHSQAGWIMPLAASRTPAARFLVAFSGPVVTADETDLYQSLTGQGERPQRQTDAAIDAAVIAAGRHGVDPMPWIRQLHIPALWVFGGRDEHVPTRLSVARLEPVAQEQGRDFSIRIFPNANHALVETETGLTSEMLRSDRFALGMFPFVSAWLRAHRLT
ncbi:MAG TPA: alpha/beta hydrolase [Gaiellaceae bacterium]|nr:alpha/beta hydrolase [Gaiellaceae bacterium]